MGFESGRAAYSLKAISTLLDAMRDGAGKDEFEAIDTAYPETRIEPERSGELPFPEPTGNTVVDVALRQIHDRVNRAIKALGGPPTQVIVELSRDLPLGIKKRNEIELAIAKNTEARKDAAKDIAAHDESPTRRNIDRYLLWQEQEKRFCPFCEKPINLHDALDGSETNFEHILPQSLTHKRGGRGQMVLAHRSCNDAKRDKTPYQAWGDDPNRWAVIKGHAEAFKKTSLRAKRAFSSSKTT